MHEHGVQHAVDAAEELALGHQRRVHAELDAAPAPPGDAEVLDAVAELGGEGDVGALDER